MAMRGHPVSIRYMGHVTGRGMTKSDSFLRDPNSGHPAVSCPVLSPAVSRDSDARRSDGRRTRPVWSRSPGQAGYHQGPGPETVRTNARVRCPRLTRFAVASALLPSSPWPPLPPRHRIQCRRRNQQVARRLREHPSHRAHSDAQCPTHMPHSSAQPISP